jgi:hypothetical protein
VQGALSGSDKNQDTGKSQGTATDAAAVLGSSSMRFMALSSFPTLSPSYTRGIQSKQDQRRGKNFSANSSCTSGAKKITRSETKFDFELN